MPRTIAVDRAELLRVQLLREPDGGVEVFVEYALRSGTQVVQTVHRSLRPHIGPGRRAALAALLDAVAADVAAVERV